MKIVGCDFHPCWQQIAVFDVETGEIVEHKLKNGEGEAERFYEALESPALIGIEACGNSQWFIELAERFGHVVWVGDDAAGRGPDYVAGVCADHRRCEPVPAQQPGSQLCWSDSARALLGRQAAAGSDQQAGQPFSTPVAGGSRADGQPAG
jgi:hypothetical protein